MVIITQLLENCLLENSTLMKHLQPKLVLVGSTQEGSRIGIGNEIDLTVHFEGWEKPFKISGDAFHLHKSESCPEWMNPYFDSDNQFLFDKFINDICQTIADSLDFIFAASLNPQRLTRVQTNEDYLQNSCDACKEINDDENSLYIQCPNCVVCVSRTKMGVCLQFEWHHEDIRRPVFCSMDWVPIFPIEPEDIKAIIRLVNACMIGRLHPPQWLNHLKNFLKEDRLVEELWSRGDKVDKVLLKSLGNDKYFIRGGQNLRPEDFCNNDRLIAAYSLIKVLRTFLKIENLSNFMVKKMLMDPLFVEMASSEENGFQLVAKIISHSKFKVYFGPYLGAAVSNLAKTLFQHLKCNAVHASGVTLVD